MLWLILGFTGVRAETIQLDNIHVIDRPSSLYEFIPSTTTLEREQLQKNAKPR